VSHCTIELLSILHVSHFLLVYCVLKKNQHIARFLCILVRWICGLGVSCRTGKSSEVQHNLAFASVSPNALHWNKSDTTVRVSDSKNLSLNLGLFVAYKKRIDQLRHLMYIRCVSIFTRYGDCTRRATDEEVIAAARNANIHDFVETLSKVFYCLLAQLHCLALTCINFVADVFNNSADAACAAMLTCFLL